MRKLALSIVAVLFLAVCATAATAKLAWDASPSSGVVGYNVYRSTVSGSGYVKIAYFGSTAVPTNTAPFLDATVPNTGERFHYVVTAVNSAGMESGFSNEVFFVSAVPVGPSNLRIVP